MNLSERQQIQISDAEFEELKGIMYSQTGVYLKPTKKTLLVSRLRSRIEELGLPSMSAYLDLLKAPRSSELDYFINAVTTNETYCFRHSEQFNFLYETAITDIVQTKKKNHIKIWSAACSTGEEPYSIAITCKEYMQKHPSVRFEIFASDVNTEVIEQAKKAQFVPRSVSKVPQSLLNKYFAQVEVEERRLRQVRYEVAPNIRNMVKFFQGNILQPPKLEGIDIVFLRNVLIYFDHASKQRAVDMIQKAFDGYGYLFISLSENLNDVASPFRYLKSGIYVKDR